MLIGNEDVIYEKWKTKKLVQRVDTRGKITTLSSHFLVAILVWNLMVINSLKKKFENVRGKLKIKQVFLFAGDKQRGFAIRKNRYGEPQKS